MVERRQVATARSGQFLTGFLAAVALLAYIAAPSFASPSHSFTGTFGSASSTIADPYPLSEPTDVEIDQTSHDVYVTDPGNHRVEKFDSEGHFLLMFGKEVDKTKTETSGASAAEKNLCTAASGDTCQPGVSSGSAGGFQDPAYLAVDNYPGGEGDIYVGDSVASLVSKYDSSGHPVTSWGVAGQKDGSDDSRNPGFGPIVGLAVGGACADTKHETTQKVCHPVGELFVNGTKYNSSGIVQQYNRAGEYVRAGFTPGNPWLKVDSNEDFFTGGGGFFGQESQVYKTTQKEKTVGEGVSVQMSTDFPTRGIAFDPSTEEMYQDVGAQEGGHGPQIDHYSAKCDPSAKPCEPIDTFGGVNLQGGMGIAVDGNSHTLYAANSTTGDVAIFGDSRPVISTGSATELSENSFTLTGTVDPAGRGAITDCHFEFGETKTYGTVVPCTPDPASSPPGSNFTVPTQVKATVTGLSPGTRRHYRLVATNASGAFGEGVDRLAATTQPPAIDGLLSDKLTATGAMLIAQINPNGLETSYRFEYGTGASYGQVAPVPDGTIAAGNGDQQVSVQLENLTSHVVYHYRLIAVNADGTSVTGDQTFNFYPPTCPNENVRQQTQANYLPECRAYELVTPGNAGGTQIFPDGPNTGYASNPARFTYTGVFSTVPGAGGSPIDGAGDLYAATRTDTGWVSKYIGLPSNKAAVDGGPPLGPPGSTPWEECEELYYHSCFREPSALAAASGVGAEIQNGVLTDEKMDKFADFNDGNQSIESIFTSDFHNKTVIASLAPYVWAADGTALDRWPTNLPTVPRGSYNGVPVYSYGSYVEGPPSTVAPGGVRALDCPYATETGSASLNADYCPGDVTASADLSHFVFATEWNEFAPGGKLGAPGSVYDNNTVNSTVVVASKTPAGENIPSEPTDGAGDPLQIPGVSKDGSHVLMAAGGNGPCGYTSCAQLPCGADYSMVRRCIMQPSHLYMRVDGAVTYDVSQGKDVRYVGMSGDGTKVYFISEEHLTGEDFEHTGGSLFMWSEQGVKEGHPLTLISKADNPGNPGEPGNTSNCNAEFVRQCGVSIYTQLYYCGQGSVIGGNCLSDNFIASQSGEIYFISPEQLEGTRGVPNQENLYVYRNGKAQYVTTLKGAPYCYETYSTHKCVRLERMQVSPDGSHMAFITNSQLTQYENEGYQEMYTYNPESRKLVCVSCNQNGEPPKSNALASQDGLFMTNDGRAFFSTEDALVHADTNEAEDVYEYVEGRPQLITPGTGDTSSPNGGGFGFGGQGGLIGVSADGRDAFFGTFQTLVPSDHNGLFFKVYDARSGGGFPSAAPPPPCAAADECHGVGSEPPTSIQNGSGGSRGNHGNAATARHGGKKHKKRHHRRHPHSHGASRPDQAQGRSGR